MKLARINNLTSKNLPKISAAFTIVINLTTSNAYFEGVSLRPSNGFLSPYGENCLDVLTDFTILNYLNNLQLRNYGVNIIKKLSLLMGW